MEDMKWLPGQRVVFTYNGADEVGVVDEYQKVAGFVLVKTQRELHAVRPGNVRLSGVEEPIVNHG